MKKSILTTQDAFTFLLQGMYFIEARLMEELGSCTGQITSTALKDEVKRYRESAHYKQLKLERIFSYLMNDTNARKIEVIDKLMEETHKMLDSVHSGHLRDILMIGCIQNVNAYKTASYRTAYLLAVELELDTVADLLQQILEWEVETGRTLASIASHEFCRLTGDTKPKNNAWTTH